MATSFAERLHQELRGSTQDVYEKIGTQIYLMHQILSTVSTESQMVGFDEQLLKLAEYIRLEMPSGSRFIDAAYRFNLGDIPQYSPVDPSQLPAIEDYAIPPLLELALEPCDPIGEEQPVKTDEQLSDSPQVPASVEDATKEILEPVVDPIAALTLDEPAQPQSDELKPLDESGPGFQSELLEKLATLPS